MFAPAKTPAAVVERLNAELSQILLIPEFLQQLDKAGFSPMGGTPEDARKYVLSEQAQWAKLIRENGIKF